MLMPEVIAELRRLEAAAKQEIQSGKLGRVAWVDWTCALQDNSDALLSAAGEAQELASEHDKVLEYARKAAGTRDVHSVYEVLDLVEGLREERERQNAFLNGILVGGNHLASALIHWLGAGDDTFPPYQTEIHEAREIIADPLHWDAWVCWRSIMLARDAARSEEHPRRHQRGETMSDYRKRLEAAVKSIQQEHLRMLTNGDGGGMAAREMAEYFDMAIGYTAVCEALWKCERWMSSYSPALSSDALQSARAALRVARGEEKPTDRASEENLEVARKWWLIYFEDHEMRPEVFESESVAQARFTELSQNWNCHLFHSVARGEKHCKWCAEGAPEWSFDAKIWIHRRDRLDRRCENPPNNYGYTTQVPEMTVSDEKRAESRGEKTENNCHCDFSDAWRCARARRLGEVACTCACHRGASLSGQEVPREQV